MGKIITFYSYKGGVGRTMALANVAVVLAMWKYKVLVVDWDLEAPGLEFFFKKYVVSSDLEKNGGVINLITSWNTENWSDYIKKVEIQNLNVGFDMLESGYGIENYFNAVRNFDIDAFYQEQNGGEKIESFRNKWKEKYDFVLIDSRTGITDVGGICTVQLPDMVIMLSSTTEQSINGIFDTARMIARAKKQMPVDRYNIKILPILSRSRWYGRILRLQSTGKIFFHRNLKKLVLLGFL